MPAPAESPPRGPTAAQLGAVAELGRVFPVLDDLGARMAAAGHRLYLVGGSVRDALLGRLGHDLDLTTDATPAQVRAVVDGWAEAVYDLGVAYGTVGVGKGGLTLEITTYRTETYDRADRHPQVQFGTSLAQDLVRRDFTINAMAVAVPFGAAADGAFVDLHGGLADLEAGVLRTPGRPEASFDDDPLRIMRAARFVAQLGLRVPADVLDAMCSRAHRLGIVSAERVRDELVKTLLAPDPVGGLELLVDTGAAEVVLPELPALRLERDEHHRHKDVYRHTLTVLENAITLEPDGPDLTLRLAALLHDIGKPATRGFGPRGQVTFHHHEVEGMKMSARRLKALRFPKDLTADVARLVELHLRFHGYGTGEWTDSAVRRYVVDAGPLLARLHRLVRSDCTTRNRRRAAALQAAYDSLEARIAFLDAAEELKAARRPDLDGVEVMRLLGIPPGREVGEALRHLSDLKMEHGPLEPDVAVAALRAWASQSGLGVAD